MSDIDNLLDGTLDDLSDMPEFKPFNPGVHLCTVKMEQKTINKFPAIEVALTLKETQEAAPGYEPMVAGATTNTAYFLRHDNPQVAELGQGKFKELLKPIGAANPGKSNRELMAIANGGEFLVVTGLRDNKEKTKQYTDIIEWSMV